MAEAEVGAAIPEDYYALLTLRAKQSIFLFVHQSVMKFSLPGPIAFMIGITGDV